MISPDDIIARLKAALPAGTLRNIGGAGDMASAFDQVNISKLGFVVPAGETALPNSAATQLTVQKVTSSFTVFTFFSKTDATGAKALNDVVAVREALKSALVGWFPDGENEPVQYRDATMVQIDPKTGFLVYAQTFFNSYQLRN